MTKHKIILFDGVCHLCQHVVYFTIKRDKKKIFKFAPFQSANGKRLIEKYQIQVVKNLSSVVLIEKDNIYYKSSAILRILLSLNSPWKLSYSFIIIPRGLRDKIYDIIGKHRYRWFGKSDTCLLPDKTIQDRFNLEKIDL